MSNAGKKDYSVGYGKPPKSTQFKKGQSGNPKGRPKGSFSLTTEIESELNQKVTVTEQGQQRTVPKRRVIAKQLVNKAASGDLKATNLVLSHSISSRLSDRRVPLVQEEERLRLPIHHKTLESVVERIRSCHAQVSFGSHAELDAEPVRKSSPPRRRVKLI